MKPVVGWTPDRKAQQLLRANGSVARVYPDGVVVSAQVRRAEVAHVFPTTIPFYVNDWTNAVRSTELAPTVVFYNTSLLLGGVRYIDVTFDYYLDKEGHKNVTIVTLITQRKMYIRIDATHAFLADACVQLVERDHCTIGFWRTPPGSATVRWHS